MDVLRLLDGEGRERYPPVAQRWDAESREGKDNRIAALQGFPVFPEQYISAYAGWLGLLELRIVSAGVQYRPLGFYGPDRGQFSLLVGGVEKGKIPKHLLEVADERRKIVIRDPSRVRRHDFS